MKAFTITYCNGKFVFTSWNSDSEVEGPFVITFPDDTLGMKSISLLKPAEVKANIPWQSIRDGNVFEWGKE